MHVDRVTAKNLIEERITRILTNGKKILLRCVVLFGIQ